MPFHFLINKKHRKKTLFYRFSPASCNFLGKKNFRRIIRFSFRILISISYLLDLSKTIPKFLVPQKL